MPPLIEIAIEPKSAADQRRLEVALERLASDDPTFSFTTDPESGQTVIAGVDEQQIEDKVGRMLRDFRVDVVVGAPQVAYRETITRPAEITYTHMRQAGGSGQYAKISLRFEPAQPGQGYAFESTVV